MELKAGYVYFVLDDFFEKVQDSYLKINYISTKRPHYFAFYDKNTSLYWLVPCSSKIEKFQNIIEKRRVQNKSTDGIKIITIQNQKTVLLFQDMFPILSQYISEPYLRANQPFYISNPNVVAKLEKNAKKVIGLLRHGIKFTPTQPDIHRIEVLMLSELNQIKNSDSSYLKTQNPSNPLADTQSPE